MVMNLKKTFLIIILSFLILLIGASCVSAGFFDFLGGESKDTTQFVDNGIENNCSNEWYVQPNVTKVVTANGTVVSSSEDSGVYANKPNTGLGWKETFEWTSPFTIEFDVVDWSGVPLFRIIDYNHHDASKNFGQLQINKGSHVKITSTDKEVTYYVDDNQKLSVNGSFTDAQIGFRVGNSSVTYKNFKIY